MSVCLDRGAINQGSGNTQVATEYLTVRRQIAEYCSFFFVFLVLNHWETRGVHCIFRCLRRQGYFFKRKNISSHSTFITLKDLKTHF